MQQITSRGRAAGSIFAVMATLAGSTQAAVVIPAPPPLDVRSVADRVHSLTVAVHARAFPTNSATDQNGPLNSASGVLIGNGLVLTSLSAVALKRSDGQLAPPATIEVVTDQAGIVPARFLMSDPALDLAVLQLPDQLRELDGATLSPSDPAVGQSLIAIGAEGDALYVVGVSLDRVEFASRGGARLYVNRPLPPAFSGGPLFDAEGRLAGISTSSGSDSAFPLPASLLRTVIDRVHALTRS